MAALTELGSLIPKAATVAAAADADEVGVEAVADAVLPDFSSDETVWELLPLFVEDDDDDDAMVILLQ